MVTWFDLLCVAILIFCTIRGAMRGVVWQLAGIAGVVLCLMFAETVAAAIGPKLDIQEPLNHWVVMFGSYLFFSFIAFAMARMITGALDKSQMTEYNRHLGALFGLTKGAIFCLVLTFFIVTFSKGARESIRGSRAGHYSAVMMDRIHPMMPAKLKLQLDRYINIDRLEQNLDQVDDGVDSWASEDSRSNSDDRDPNARSGWGFGNANRDTDSGYSSRRPVPRDPVDDRYTAADKGGLWGSSDRSSTNSPRQGTSNAPRRNSAEGGDFLSEIKSSLSREAYQAVANAWENTDPQSRAGLQNKILDTVRNTPPAQMDRLGDSLLNQGASDLRDVFDSWMSGSNRRPSTAPASKSYSNNSYDSNMGSRNSGSSSNGRTSSNFSNNDRPSRSTSNTRRTPDPDEDASTRMLREISEVTSSHPKIQDRLQQEAESLLSQVPEQVRTGVLEDWWHDATRQKGQDPDPQTRSDTTLEQRIMRQMERAGLTLRNLAPQLQDRLQNRVGNLPDGVQER